MYKGVRIMQIIKKDILTVASGIICQQVNCKGVMGAGLAAKLRKKWPVVYEVYRKQYENKQLKLGSISLAGVYSDLIVCNMAAQDGYGRDGKRYTDYTAFAVCLSALSNFITSYSNMLPATASTSKIPVYFPYKIGCGLGGGDWDIMLNLIVNNFPEAIIMQV